MSLGFCIETQELPSANQTSRPLRQVMYGLLLGKDKFTPVEEIDREGLTLISVPVKPTFTRTSKRLRLDSLPQVSLFKLKTVNLSFMSTSPSVPQCSFQGLTPILMVFLLHDDPGSAL